MSLVDKTVRVRRGGSYLTIPSSAVDRYMAKGYDVVDNMRNVLKESIPNDINLLKAAYDKHVAEIRELKKINAELERQLADASTTASKRVTKKKP